METCLINSKHPRRSPIVVEVTITYVPMTPEEIPAWNESARMFLEIGKKALAKNKISANEPAILGEVEGLHPNDNKPSVQGLYSGKDAIPVTG